LDAATYSLGTVYNNSNFTVGSITKSAADLQVSITGTTGAHERLLEGRLPRAVNVWAASDGTANSNW